MRIEGAFLHSRIARRIVALFVLCAVVPVAAMAMLALDRVHSMISQQEERQLLQLNESYGTAMYERLIAIDRQLRTLAASADDSARWSDDARARLSLVFDALAVVGPDGGVRNLLGTIDDIPALSSQAKAHLATGESALATQERGTFPAHVFLSTLLTASDPEGGRIVAEVHPGYLWGEEGTFPALTDFVVVDERDRLLFSTTSSPVALAAYKASRSDVAAGSLHFDEGSERYLANFREVFMQPRFAVHGWTVIAARPEAQMIATMDAFKAALIPAAVLALLIVALFSIALIRRTLIPLGKLTAGTRRAADQDFTVRVDEDAQDEFGDLARSFNAMTARLGSQFNALMTLADIDRAILSRLDVSRVLETVVLRLRDIVPAEFVSVAVLDRNAGAILRIYSRDQRVDGPVEIERSACVDQDLQSLLAHPEGTWIDADARVAPYTAPLMRLGAMHLFVLPIIWQDAVVGAVVLGSTHDAVLTEEERARARDLGDRVGVAFATAVKDEQLYHQAHYDSLTQLPNRLYFKDQLARRIVHAQRDRKRFALLFIDLDHFKKVNDGLGHAAGDDLLRQAAERLRRCVREADAVARLGGDEFTVVLSEIRMARDAEVVANNVIAAISAPFVIGTQEQYLSASVGIAIYPTDGHTVDELLRNSDTAMYRAKESGRGRAVYFEERMNAAAQQRVTFERDMRHAIDGNEFVVFYQPQMDLATGAIVGAEALVRWNHPRRGLLSPLHFIQLAEETGLIEPLGEWVLREACRQYVAWRDEGLELPRVAVNVSARQFRQRDFAGLVSAMLQDSRMPASALELEVTETLLMDASRNIEVTLGKLGALGVRIALDDFGTGYSSLGYLKRFPVDIVKIDRAFIKDLPGDESSAAITAAIVAMAHALQKEVIAEGVAEPEQAAYLRRMRCDLMQGYHLSKPLPASEFAEFLRKAGAAPALDTASRAA
jgi:diguanylate cyclase (GGDEF)-like protein